MTVVVHPDYLQEVRFAAAGPQPQVWLDSPTLKVVLVGLEPGQRLPAHPGPAGVYHFLEGSGWMMVADERHAVRAGATVVVPDGARRGIEAETRLAFLGVRAQAEAGG